MGEEYGERRPFQFFTDHIDPAIAEATREGRRKEFESFTAFSGEDIPDPQDAGTFRRSKLSHQGDPVLRELYRELIALRRDAAARGSRRAGDEPSADAHRAPRRRYARRGLRGEAG